MKKKIFLIIVLLMMPIIVKADAGMPSFDITKVIISNPNGAFVYDFREQKTGEILEYGREIEVFYEEGEYLYLDTTKTDIQGILIKKNDVIVKSNQINLDEFTTINQKFITLEDVKIYKGPFSIYGETGVTIPKNTEIVIEKTKDYFWGYVNQGEYKGFVVYSEPVSSAFAVLEVRPLTTFKSVKLYENNDRNSNVITTIPSGTDLKSIYIPLSYSYYNPAVYVEYLGKTGWILDDYASNFDEGYYQIKITNPELIKLRNYKNYLKEEKVTLKKDVYDCEVKYFNQEIFLYSIEENGTKYWIYSEIDDDFGYELIFIDEPKQKEENEISNDNNQENNQNNLNFSLKEVIIIGVIASGILALTTGVTISLINKKKS